MQTRSKSVTPAKGKGKKATPAYATPESTPTKSRKRAAPATSVAAPSAKRLKSEAPLEVEGRSLRNTPARKEVKPKLVATPSKTPPRRGRPAKAAPVQEDSEASEDEVVYALRGSANRTPAKTPNKGKAVARIPSPAPSPPRRVSPSPSSVSSLPASPLLEPVASTSRSSSPEPTTSSPVKSKPFSQIDDIDTEPEYEPEEELVTYMEAEAEQTPPSSYSTALIKSLINNTLSCLHGRTQPYLPLPSTSSTLASYPCLPGMKTYEADLRSTLERTVKEGEGNCLLLVGPRSVGKSAIVERSLDLLSKEKEGFLVVRLSGLVQVSDRLALREIARQLCRDAEGVDDDGSAFTSNAATLASLLAILEPNSSTASYTEADNSNKPIIFILDEFDLFALRDQRQSFLYCLLDIVQSKRRKGGMAVVGLSARTDCINTLEKRVKSRCQSRVHQITPPSTLSDFLAVASCRMKASPELLETESFTASCLAKEWDANVKKFLASESVQNMADCVFSISKSKAELLSELSKAVNKMMDKCVEEEMTLPQLKYIPPKSNSSILASLDDLSCVELSVLVSAKHVTSDGNSFNLAMAYDLYKQHIKRNSLGKVTIRGYNKELYARAFERLYSVELIQDAATTGRGKALLSGPFKMCRLVPWYEQIDAAVYGRSDVPQHLRKWCKTWTE